MPINLPNGLIIPEAGDSESLACSSIEDLFRAVNTLQTEIDEPVVVECVTVPATSFALQGAADCSEYQASTLVPAGVDASKSSLAFYTASGERVHPCYSIAGGNIIIETNTNEELTVVYA